MFQPWRTPRSFAALTAGSKFRCMLTRIPPVSWSRIAKCAADPGRLKLNAVAEN